MALDYTAIFGDVGKIIARLDSYPTIANSTLAADFTTLVTQFSTRWLPAEGVASLYEQFKASVSSWRQRLGALAQKRLSDRTTVTDDLRLDAPSIERLVSELRERMLIDGKALKSCLVTLGAATARTSPPNGGNGTVYATTMLDGFNRPGANMPASVRYTGAPSELAATETMTLTCTSDSTQDGLEEGDERFAWSGASPFPVLDVRGEGSGTGPTITCANGGGIITGGDFDSFASSTPSGWTVAAGTPGTNIAESDTYYRKGAVLLTGGADVRLTQSIADGVMQGRRLYHLACAVKADTVGPGAASLQVALRSPDRTPGSLPRVYINGASLPTSWTTYYTWVILQPPLPTSITLEIILDGAPSTLNVRVSSVSFKEADYHGGIGLAVTAGSTPWQRGDQVTWSVTNDGAGKFQNFFRRFFGAQMPSVKPGSFPWALLAPFYLLPIAVTESPLDSLVA